MAVLIFLSLSFFLYWKTFNNAVMVEQVNTKHRVTDKTTVSKVSVPDSKQLTQTSSTNPPRVNLPNTKEVEEAINFLDGLQQETHAENTNTIPKGIASKGNPSQDEMFELLHEGISYYDSFLESASVKFSLVMTSLDYHGIPRAPSGTWNGIFEFSGSQVRGSVTENITQYGGEFGGIPHSDTHEFANNGETYELLQDTLNGKRLTRRNKMMHNPFHDPRFWGWNLSGDEPLTALIDSIDIKNIQPVEWNGSQVYHIKGSTTNATTDVDLWLNPEKSYRPERFVYSLQSKGVVQVRVTKDFNFQEVAPDLWFPESAQSVTTVINTETGEETNIENATITFTDVRVNEHIPLSRFSIDSPSGTNVFDMRSRETYTVGGDD
jgi:hypothetical protein